MVFLMMLVVQNLLIKCSGDPVIMKYLYSSEAVTATAVANTKGEWFLYRAAKLHLRYAEAANRDNQQKIADAILNYGIKSAYSPEILVPTRCYQYSTN